MPQRLHGLLRWSEKFMKTDMVYLASGGFWLSVGTFVTAFSSFILSIAFANLLPQEAYGTYKYVLSVAAIFSAFTLTGLETAVTYAVSRGYEGMLKTSFLTNILWSIPASGIALVGAFYYFLHANPTLALAYVLIAIVQPLTVSVNFGAAYLAGKKAFRDLALFYSIDNLIPAFVLIGLMTITKSALWVLIAYFVSNLVTTAGMYRFVLWKFKPNDAEDPDAVTYGKHLSAMNVLANVADNFDKILTFHFLGAAQLAVYSFALALPSQTKLITKPLFNLIFPKFTERPEEEIRKTMGEKILRFFLWGLFLFIAYAITAPFFFHIFYPKYLDAVFLSQIYAVSLMATTAAPLNIFLTAKRKVGAQYISNIGVSVFQLASAAIGIWLGGLMGLILARVATRYMGSFFSAFFYYRNTERNASVTNIL